MHRLITTLVVLAFATTSFGEIQFRPVLVSSEIIDLYAYTSGNTGTNLVAYELTYEGQGFSPYNLQFGVYDTDGNGTPDTPDLDGTNPATPTWFRIGTAVQTTVVSANPSPALTEPNPYLVTESFTITVTTPEAVAYNQLPTTPNGPYGQPIARLYYPGLPPSQNPYVTPGVPPLGLVQGGIAGSAGFAANVFATIGYIPEPSSLATLVVIGTGVLARRRRR